MYALHVQYISKVSAFESIKNNLSCQTFASPERCKAAILINGAFRSTLPHIPQEVA
jgi:hypothetical protein